MKIVKIKELAGMPLGTAFVPVTGSCLHMNDFSIITRKAGENFIGAYGFFYDHTEELEEGKEIAAEVCTYDATADDYGDSFLFAVFSVGELKEMKDALDYAVECGEEYNA